MPPGPANAVKTGRRAESSAKEAKVDIGKQLGQFDTPNVRHRVRQWQAEGGGVAQAQNEIVVEYDDDEDDRAQKHESGTSRKSTPKVDKDAGTDREDYARRRSPTKSPRPLPRARAKTGLDDGRGGWVRPKVKPNKELEEEIKFAGAPKKRVISDGHWRKDRSSPKPKDTTESKPYTINRTVVYTENDPKKPRRPLYDDGIRVRSMPLKHVSGNRSSPDLIKRHSPRTPDSSRPVSRGASDRPHHSGPDRDSDHSAGHTKRKDSRRVPSPSERSSAVGQESSIAPDDSISKRHGQAPKAVEKSPRNKTPELKKSHSKKQSDPFIDAPVKAPLATPPKVHGNRIEAWLSATPEGPPSEADDASETASVSRKSVKSSREREDRKPPVPLHTDDGAHASSATSSVAATELDLSDRTFNKHTPGANLKRQFPSTGKRLSTIASVETLQTRAQSPALSEVSEQLTIVPEHGRGPTSGSGLKRRLTKHEDLMSVLSMPRAEPKNAMSHRTSSRMRREKITPKDLWNELSVDEAKYQRELRTLVDGVIPVLLSCVLSKADSPLAAGLFGRSAPSEATVTKPIVDMGIALERLKAHHKRIPAKEETSLYTWAQGATRIYTDYLKAWRLGFQDVVVNLAPASKNDKPGWDDGLLKNEEGDLVNTDGDRVDVAFLLKRPLVRLKYLAKTFKGFNHVLPSPTANTLADRYQQLVIEARKRSNEERARLEDEAAASIDPKRARDPRNLAPLAGVSIDPTRCVHARDYFDVELRHSSGQQLDCKIEMILRDDAPDRGDGGDILICEVSDTGRWLLFPPTRLDLVSARSGSRSGDLVVMIRGVQSDGREWQELLSLHANEDDAAPEWIQMLGMEPVPPSLKRGPSFLSTPARPSSSHSTPSKVDSGLGKSRPPSIKEIEVPIGEVAGSTSKTWEDNASHVSLDNTEEASPLRQSGTVHRKPIPPSKSGGDKPAGPSKSPLRELFTSIDNALSDSAAAPRLSTSLGLKRSKAKKYRQSPLSPPGSPPLSEASSSSYMDVPQPLRTTRPTHSRTHSEATYMSGDTTSTGSRKKSYTVWLPPSTAASDESESDGGDADELLQTPVRPLSHRRTSSVPSMDLPSSPKVRSPSATSQDPTKPGEEIDEPSSAPAKLQKRKKSVSIEAPVTKPKPLSPTPPPAKHKLFSIPSFTPAFLKRHRRSSSPLKHQYEPSIISGSSSDSMYSDEDDSDDSITSESSDESDGAEELKPPALDPIGEFERQTPPSSEPSLPNNTLSPSQSASQAPYRTVPQQAGGASRAVATIFSWSDRGAWENLHPQECNIVVTPGLIEAFDIDTTPPTTSDGSEVTSPSSQGHQPLVAFELTPLVPLRRGTALDISIRSPPTEKSLIRSSNNVMFRSRSAEECEQLYSMINMARINNPTYIALQNARGPFNENTWAAAMERRNSNRTTKNSWWGLPSRKSSTYRSKSSRPQSVNTDSSVGTMNSAFSALRRFSGSNGIFDIAKSKITSKDGSLATSESLSSGSSTPIVMDPSQGTPLGITNAKIRLHFRETQNKWRDMGSARMTIMLPPRPSPNAPASPRTTGLEKRILIQGKTHGETLLDVTLGESCFERVARTGIAVSVWEDNMGPNGEVGHAAAVGGVMSSKPKIYMIQMKSERDCTYTFGMVGKFRY
ncbi:hypothetical protein AAFC00_003046 [Neodothiora populina]|uniref:SRm160/300 splicing coactivator n=1 Tax=Neodothiora populina TaxID=2781224 RepID=A0ABR3P945_9PEZI